jgi:uncharacterized protein (TIGR03067 family)
MGCRFAVALLLPLFTIATAGLGEQPAKPEAGELQGTWKMVAVEIKGDTVDLKSQPRWIIKDNKLRYGGMEVAQLTIDPNTKPRIIDLAAVDPNETFEGIYTLDKDTLKVCINVDTTQKERPADFGTKDKDSLRLFLFERVKGAEKDETEGCNGYVGLALKKEMEPERIIIADALEGGPAQKAGLKKDDTVVSVGGAAATDLRATVDLCRQAKPGQNLVIRVKRDGKEMDITVKVGVFPWKYTLYPM